VQKKYPDSAEQKNRPDIVAEFMSRYRKEYDFYEQACRIAAQLLDASLQSAGVRAIVTSRAKNLSRLEEKVRQRALSKVYKSVNEIYEDIVDLAGIRVALYFPAERDATGRIISSLFDMLENPREFPDSTKPQPSSYKKRFSGYWATHYRARIRDEHLNESQKRYLDARFEIQVASVLMHAWSEVEHDLIYKPLQGPLWEEEYSILDELNGLVLTGEIALERLQRAGEIRVSHNRVYSNHYDLASSLLELVREQQDIPELHDALIGRVDLLFKLLQRLELNTPEHVSEYVKRLWIKFETNPIAEQVINWVLAEDPKRYAVFNAIQVEDGTVTQSQLQDEKLTTAIGEFVVKYAEFEQQIRTYVMKKEAISVPTDFVDIVTRMREFRSNIVHKGLTADLQTVTRHQQELQGLIDYFSRGK